MNIYVKKGIGSYRWPDKDLPSFTKKEKRVFRKFSSSS